MGTPITSKQYVHSCYARGEFPAIVAKVKEVTIDSDTTEVLSSVDTIEIIDNPTRKVWITLPEYRNHTYKKETEKLSHCQVFTAHDANMNRELYDILQTQAKYDSRIQVTTNWKYPKLKELCDCPYVYGVDLSMEALVRTRRELDQKHGIVPITTGAFDIETSVLGDSQINAVTVICEHRIYTACLKSFMSNNLDSATGRHVYISSAKIKEMALSDAYLGPYFKKYPQLTLEIKEFEYEGDLLKWIFNRIHYEHVDYIGIWNIGYDIPMILDRLQVLNIDPRDIFCDPCIPNKYRYVHFKEDKKKVAHVIEKWHWSEITSQTQYVDSMLTYGRIRKAKPKDSKYNLDYIAKKELGAGKLEFHEAGHYEMQSDRFAEYVVYNINDALLVQMMEWENHDITTMYQLTERSHQSEFNKQSVMLKNAYQLFCLEHGSVLATVGMHMKGPYDDEIPKVGGAVLDATFTRNIGTHCLIERPSVETQLLAYIADHDYSSLYPSIKIATGISKESKYGTCTAIEGQPVEVIELLFGAITNPQENAIWIGEQFFNLPGYEEMRDIVAEKLKRVA